MTRRGVVVAGLSGTGVALLALAMMLATAGAWGDSPETPQSAVAATPETPPFSAVPLDDDSAWTARENESGAAKLIIGQFGTELGYVRMGTSTTICAQVIDAQGAPVQGARVAFVAHGPAAIEPAEALTNEVGSACASLTPHEAGSLHVQATATKEGYEPASAGKVSEVVAAPETTAKSADLNPATSPAFLGVAGVGLLVGAALLRARGRI